MDKQLEELAESSEKQKGIRGAIVRFLRLEISAHSMQALFTAWLIIAALCILIIGPFTDIQNFVRPSLYITIICTFVLWQLLTLIPVFRKRTVINCITIFSAIFLSLAASLRHTEIIFLTSLGLAVAFTIKFADIPFYDASTALKKAGGKLKWSVTALMAIVFVLFVGILCTLKYLDYGTPNYDFGLFAQMYHYMKETGLPLITCERDGLLSHFAVHVSPIYYLLLPIYFIFPSPITLQILQPMVVVSGVIPLLLICKKHSLSDLESMLFALCYVVFPTFAGGCFFYIHENCFLAPLILWLIYFLECDKAILSAVFALLVLFVKEDAPVYVCVIALYFILCNKSSKKCRLLSIGIFVFSLIYFVVVTSILANYGDGVMSWRYNNYSYDGSDSLVTVFKTAAADPVYVLQQCFNRNKMTFILETMLPLAFLPLISSPVQLILLIPFVLVNLMTTYGCQFNIYFQYAFGSGAFLIYLAVLNYSHFERGGNLKKRYKILLVAAACSMMIFTARFYSKLDIAKSYMENEETRSKIDYALTLIPEDASVAATRLILPNLSQRNVLYQIEYTEQEAEYYVLDLRYESDKFSPDDYKNEGYEEIYYEEGCVAIYRNKNYSG